MLDWRKLPVVVARDSNMTKVELKQTGWAGTVGLHLVPMPGWHSLAGEQQGIPSKVIDHVLVSKALGAVASTVGVGLGSPWRPHLGLQ